MSRALLLTILLSIQAAAADIATVVQQCEDCHGKNGVSDAADVPSIAGISAPVHGDFLLAYQEKTRPCRKGKFRHGDTARPETDMCTVAAKLSATDIEAVANHFAKLPFVAASNHSMRRKPLRASCMRAIAPSAIPKAVVTRLTTPASWVGSTSSTCNRR
jgi:sulfide dehydrogenase cytochrome subunit